MRFFFVSVILFLTGLLRGEMASLLWGGLFLFLTLYTFTFSWIALPFLRQTVRHGLPLSLSPAFPLSGSPVELVFSKLPQPFLPPGFRATLRLRGQHSPERQLKKQWSLSAFFDRPMVLTAERGSYNLRFSLEIRDVLGFTRIERPFAHQETLTVVPQRLEAPTPAHPSRGQGQKTSKSKKTRSDELLEVRKYTSGDDIRRIHWGLFAHAGEPFIRLGEENPPPTGKIILVVDSSFPPSAKDKAASLEGLLDHRLSLLRGYLENLDQPWLCLFPQSDCTPVSSMESTQWPTMAAKLRAGQPDASGLFTNLSLFNQASILIVSAPGCPGLALLASEFSLRGLTTRPFLFPMVEKPQAPRRPWWERRSREER